jgi:NTE family protein
MVLGLTFAGLSQERPGVGLALSGGGAKGFCHIGVLKVLEEINMPIDYISGTSMGSIIGGLYAIGYRAEDLEELALTIDWADLFRDDIERRSLNMEQKMWDGRYNLTLQVKNKKIQMPTGLINGQKITQLLDRYTLPVQDRSDFRRFPIPFACVATDLETGQAVVLDEGYLSDALRASMAIPTIFTPIKINNRVLVDGGIVRNLPAEDVIQLGADIVIGVDVGAPLQTRENLGSILSVLDQAISFQMVASTKEQRKLCDYLLIPDIGEFGTLDFEKVTFFLRQGEKAAREILPQLKALADSLNRQGTITPVEPVAEKDSVYINDLEISGLDRLSKKLVFKEMNMKLPARLSLNQLEENVNRLYSTRLFERVNFSTRPSRGGEELLIRATETSGTSIRIGFRYDNKNDAAVLLNSTLRNLGKWGSLLIFDLKLGNVLMLDGQYWAHTRLKQQMGFRIRGNYSRQSVDYYENQTRVARYRATAMIAEGFLGTLFSMNTILGAGIRGEYAEASPSIAPQEFESITEKQIVLFGGLEIDTYNHTVFPTSGVFLQFQSEYANNDKLELKKSFWRHYLDFCAIIPVHRHVSLLQSLFIGTNSQNDIPFHYEFLLGGMDVPFVFLGKKNSFLALKAQELRGPHAQFVQLGVQVNLAGDRFIILRGNAGNTFEEWNFDITKNRYLAGGGITLGSNTFLGPVELTLMGGAHRKALMYFNLGYKF